ncbi:MAG: hypothetical protein RIB98_11150 [Acidimicrobiales bacterium]
MVKGEGVEGEGVEYAARAEDLEAAAMRAGGLATSARDLALDIERHRVRILGHDDAPVARHTPATWSSRAATVSRTELQRSIGFSLWSAAVSLSETRVALERHAAQQDDLSRTYRDQARAALELAAAVPTD